MTSKEILENNKLIAEFMGLVENIGPYENSFSLKTDYDYMDNFTSFIQSQIEDEEWYIYPKFHSSWDWLIPVVEKIEQPDYDYFVHILGNGCFITTNNPELYRDEKDVIVESIIQDSKIKSVYMAVVEFIKYYNQL